jgi:ribosomal protein S18 acetylase RimI-like enzyme
MSAAISFRYAGPEDAGALCALIESAYRSPETAGRWSSEADLLTGPRTSVAEIALLLADRDNRFLIAEAEGRIAGCALLQRQADNACGTRALEGHAYFGMFAIAVDRQGEGLGSRLLAEAERRVRRLWNARALVLTVISLRFELIGWYGRRGYLPTGAHKPFPFGPDSGETRRDFDLMELRKTLRG